MKLALSQISTPTTPFAEAVEAYRAAGFEGIGLWEFALGGDDTADRATLAAAGLGVANCVPLVPTILPNPVMEGPDDPDERIAAICSSVERFGAFEPSSVLCLTGPVGTFGEAEARRIVVEGLRAIPSLHRDPVSRETFALDRRLRRKGALRLTEIEAALPPVD